MTGLFDRLKDADLSSQRGRAMTKPIVWRRSSRRTAIAVMLTVAIFPNPVFASPPSGGDTVRGLYDALLGTMKNGRALGRSGRFAQLQPVILQAFDLTTMARLSVGPSWATLTETQRQQMTESFGRYISALYADRFDSYSGQQLEVADEQPATSGIKVRSRIIKSNGEPVEVDYTAAPERPILADLRYLPGRRDQRGGDPALRICRDPEERGHRWADRGTKPQNRPSHSDYSQILLAAFFGAALYSPLRLRRVSPGSALRTDSNYLSPLATTCGER
jgi:phospholipid transport system substrate-binding protein